MSFTENIHLTMRKDQFLINKENKQRFINMLSMKLVERSCKTYHASGDADLLIVQKSVESASAVNTVLVGDDTDLLILFIYNASLDSCSLFLKPEPRRSTKKSRVWNIHAVKKQALIFAVASYSYMPFLGVTQHHNVMGSEKETPSRNLETALLL